MDLRLLRNSEKRTYVLPESPCTSHMVICGTRLPTYSQVLLCYIANLENERKKDTTKNKKITRICSKKTAEEVIQFYFKGRIPTIFPQKMAEKIEALHSEYKKIMKHDVERRDQVPAVVSRFKQKLTETMPFWPRGVINRMESSKKGLTEKEKETIDIDIKFLNSMMTDRRACISVRDIATCNSAIRRIDKSENIKARKEREELRQKESVSNASTSQCDARSSSDEIIGSGEFVLPLPTNTRSHKRVVKAGTALFCPHDILKSPIVVSTSVRNCITPTKLAATLHSFVEAMSGDTSKVNLNPTQAFRYRTELMSDLVEKIKENWSAPTIGSLHWDGKLVDSLQSKYSSVERLPILVSGENGLKLLGVPALLTHSSSGVGNLIANAAYDLLENWNCADCIVAMVFDTTSANTGHLTAACISIQQKLERQLLWCACRHHIGEIILSHVWNSLKLETSKSPDISVFIRLRDNFENITVYDTANYSFAIDVSDEDATATVQFCREVLSNRVMERGDYKELLQLVVMYLDKGNTLFHIHRPGALHKARWMAKIIYCIKLMLLENKIAEELPKGRIFASDQVLKIRRFVNFCVLVYIPWWYTSHQPGDAPSNDLKLWKKMRMYSDKDIQLSSTKAFSRHTWYLTEELVLLSLFSKQTTDDEKSEVVAKLLTYQDQEGTDSFQARFGNGFGKPVLPQIKDEANLSSFVGKSSWFFLKLLKINPSFLNIPIEDWDTNEEFLRASNTINSMRIVNDSAERGVKLSSDFLLTAQIETRYQNVLQVVENDRFRVPDQRKRKKTSESWFLHV